MSLEYNDFVNILKNEKALSTKGSFLCGIEKEGLRVDKNGLLAQTSHPKEIGCKLTHPHITTDYGESLVEYVTPTFDDDQKLISYIEDLHKFTYKNGHSDELIWPASMPCFLPSKPDDIQIADFGPSHIGQLKSIYRVGLGHRYGRKMQSIAGLHYNFSFSEELVSKLHTQTKSELSFVDFKSEFYFRLIRNFKRNSWLLMYLFGSSPVLDKSFVDVAKSGLQNFGAENYGLPYATSLRMSRLGYNGQAQDSIIVCFNSLKSYLESVETARLTSYEPYEKIGVKKEGVYQQLNTNLLQIDNEYYSNIRPKNPAKSCESALGALSKRGVSYVEVRLLDLNPFSPSGIAMQDLKFLHLFMFYCGTGTDRFIDNEEYSLIEDNFATTVTKGRDPKAQINIGGETRPLRQLAQNILMQISDMVKVICADDREAIQKWQKCLSEQSLKILDDALTPAGKIMQKVAQGQNFIHMILEMGQLHKRQLLKEGLNHNTQEKLQRSVDKSWRDFDEINSTNEGSFDAFLDQYFQKIKIEI